MKTQINNLSDFKFRISSDIHTDCVILRYLIITAKFGNGYYYLNKETKLLTKQIEVNVLSDCFEIQMPINDTLFGLFEYNNRKLFDIDMPYIRLTFQEANLASFEYQKIILDSKHNDRKHNTTDVLLESLDFNSFALICNKLKK